MWFPAFRKTLVPLTSRSPGHFHTTSESSGTCNANTCLFVNYKSYLSTFLRDLGRTANLLVSLRCNFALLIATNYLSIVTGLQTGQPGNRGSISAGEREFVSTSKRSFLPWNPPKFLITECQWAVSVTFIPGIKKNNVHPCPRLLGKYLDQLQD